MKTSIARPALKLAAAALLFACAPATAQLDIPGYVPCYPGTGGNLATNSPSTLTVTVDTADLRQTIHNFGASDAWSAQFVGQWPLEKRAAIADLLFEAGLDDNRDPKGIALSMWRFNIGAGSSRQTNISDRWRRADTFYNEDFTAYDWTRLPGQRWFLQAAKARGVEQVTGFVNSPPINMTKNGNAFAGPLVGTTNLADDKIDDFARYLADIVAHFREVEAIDFTVISPVNEPQWDWERGSGQEGNRYSTSDIKRVIDALAEQDLGGTRIETPESGQNDHLYRDDTDDYIDTFFDPASPDYIGDKLDDSIAGHSYWTDTVRNGLVTTRRILGDKIRSYPGLEYAMSEYSILGPFGPGRDLGIDPALFIARTAHYDLTLADASSWQWWLGISPYDYKDGLVYVDYRTITGNYYESKMLWAMGNFSRFVRPGMQRVGTLRSDNSPPRSNTEGLMVSSYIDAANNIAVTVFVNRAQAPQAITLEFEGMEIDSLIPYVTSARDDLAAYEMLQPMDEFEIPARSIVTVVGYHSRRSLPPREVSIAVGAATIPIGRRGIVPVSIFGELDFDVAEIDRATLAFGPGAASPAHARGGHLADVDGDGITDLVVHFRVPESGLAAGDELACISGATLDGPAIAGCDAIRTVSR